MTDVIGAVLAKPLQQALEQLIAALVKEELLEPTKFSTSRDELGVGLFVVDDDYELCD